MFGVGTGELLLVLVIAMLVVGPERMVGFARDAGRLLAKFRQETDSVTEEFREALAVEPEAEEAAGDREEGTAAAEKKAASTVTGTEEVAGSETQEALPKKQPQAVEGLEQELEALPSGTSAHPFVDGETEAFMSPSEEKGDGDDEKPVLIIVGQPVPKDEDVEPIVIEEPVLIVDEEGTEEGGE